MTEFNTRLSPALVAAVVLRHRLLLLERHQVVDPELEHQARVALQIVLDLRASSVGGAMSPQSAAVSTRGDR